MLGLPVQNDSHSAVSVTVWTTDRSTGTTGRCHARAADEPSLDPVFHQDSDALASATAATA